MRCNGLMWQGLCSASVLGDTQYKENLMAVLDTSHYTFVLQSKILTPEVFTNKVSLLDVPQFVLVYPEYTYLAKCWVKINHERKRGFKSPN